MATYYMYEQNVDCDLKVDLLNLDMEYLYENILEEIDDTVSSIDFVLNKYSWDGKRAYESRTHDDIIRDARENKAILLLKKREIKKLLK